MRPIFQRALYEQHNCSLITDDNKPSNTVPRLDFCKDQNFRFVSYPK